MAQDVGQEVVQY